MSGKNSEKAGIYVPWPLSVFCSSFFFEKRTLTFSRKLEGDEVPEKAGHAEREREKKGKKRQTFALLFAFLFASLKR